LRFIAKAFNRHGRKEACKRRQAKNPSNPQDLLLSFRIPEISLFSNKKGQEGAFLYKEHGPSWPFYLNYLQPRLIETGIVIIVIFFSEIR
jgi:hypothetical protein